MSKSAKTWGVPAYKKYSLKSVTMGANNNAKQDQGQMGCGNNGQNAISCMNPI